MIERPIEEELPIAATEATEEAQPVPAKRGRRKKPAVGAAEMEAAPAEPTPPEAPAAETADQAAPPEKPARKRRSKKGDAEVAPDPDPEPVPVPAANTDIAEDGDGEPRRGWWQRTFG